MTPEHWGGTLPGTSKKRRLNVPGHVPLNVPLNVPG
nr:MAG TPA: hypothetical protein [Caudoviricetes sp.]